MNVVATIKEMKSPTFRSGLGKFFRETTALAAVVSLELEGEEEQNERVIIAIRSEFLKQFEPSYGMTVCNEPLSKDWGWPGFRLEFESEALRIMPNDNSPDNGYRIRVISVKDINDVLVAIERANAFLNKTITMTVSGYGYLDK